MLMHVLGKTVVLAVVCDIRAITAIDDFQLTILHEGLQVTLLLLLTLLINHCHCLIQGDSHRYIAVMACAMTLILIIRQIDLSVGYAAGFTGAIAAILMVKAGVPWYLTIPIILLLGSAIGLLEGSIISFIGVYHRF